jgi:Calpain family cysteine protease
MKVGQIYKKSTGGAAFRFAGGDEPAGKHIQVVPDVSVDDVDYTNIGVADFFSATPFNFSNYRGVIQGGIGNCWLLSPMCALAKVLPDLLQDKFTLNSRNKTYTVRFFNFSGQPCTQTITGHLVYIPEEDVDPPRGKNELCYVGQQLGLPDEEPTNAALWPSFLEKAIAAELGGYDMLDGGDGPGARQASDGFRILTGRESILVDPQQTTMAAIQGHLASGHVIAFTTKPNGVGVPVLKSEPRPAGKFKNLLEDHAYMLDRIEGDKVILYNPHGELPHLKHNVAKPLTWAELVSVGARFDIFVRPAGGGKRRTRRVRKN